LETTSACCYNCSGSVWLILLCLAACLSICRGNFAWSLESGRGGNISAGFCLCNLLVVNSLCKSSVLVVVEKCWVDLADFRNYRCTILINGWNLLGCFIWLIINSVFLDYGGFFMLYQYSYNAHNIFRKLKHVCCKHNSIRWTLCMQDLISRYESNCSVRQIIINFWV